MKKILLFVVAIPLGLIASAVLPAIFSKILEMFMPFEAFTIFANDYLMVVLSGWIAVGITSFVVPSYKILFGSLMLGLSLIASTYMYYLGDEFNYLFLVGGILGLLLVISYERQKRSEREAYDFWNNFDAE